MPTFPNLENQISRDNAINYILTAIAMEELGLSHIINAEGEKIQYVLGTIPGITGPNATIEEILSTNKSVQSVLDSAVQNQLLLKGKMESALNSSVLQGPIRRFTFWCELKLCIFNTKRWNFNFT